MGNVNTTVETRAEKNLSWWLKKLQKFLLGTVVVCVVVVIATWCGQRTLNKHPLTGWGVGRRRREYHSRTRGWGGCDVRLVRRHVVFIFFFDWGRISQGTRADIRSIAEVTNPWIFRAARGYDIPREHTLPQTLLNTAADAPLLWNTYDKRNGRWGWGGGWHEVASTVIRSVRAPRVRPCGRFDVRCHAHPRTFWWRSVGIYTSGRLRNLYKREFTLPTPLSVSESVVRLLDAIVEAKRFVVYRCCRPDSWTEHRSFQQRARKYNL
jgi:hypothetical protein